MLSARVSLKDRGYSILVGRNLLAGAGRLIRNAGITQSNVLVVSQNEIPARYKEALVAGLKRENFSSSFFIPPPSKSSEAAKSLTVYSKLIREIVSKDGSNKSLFLIALGGGVIGDLTGFAASVYRRGIPYVQIPTTVTAQVDSAIGGKTGIDLPEGKNLLGSVYQPALVLSDVSLLNSLPDRHWSDGFAEVIKYGVIKDAELFSWLEKIGVDDLRKNEKFVEKIVFRCVRIKAKIVEEDEFDKKEIRIVLNFGHTAGHGIEAASRFSRQYTHGEAVAIGMLVASDIAAKLGVLKDRSLISRLEKTLIKYNLPLYHKGLQLDAILKAMGYDKKSEDGKNRFVLPVSLGKTLIRRGVPSAVIQEALSRRKG